MSETIELSAELRSDLGKGASRRLRKTGLVPAIVYGADAEPTSISLKHNEFIHQLENEAVYTQVLALNIAGKKQDVLLRDLQRHPFKNLIMHADFLRIDQEKPVNVVVPLHFINEDKCYGVKQEGGMLNHLVSEIEILCLPKYLPEYIEVDVSDIKLGESLHLSDLKIPEGVEIPALTHGEAHDTGVAAVNKTRENQPEDEEQEGGEETTEE